MTEIDFKIGDITELEVDAIVNPANNDLILGGGVAGAIRRNGGSEIQEECNKLAPIPLGEAVVTSSGKLKSKHVIHAAVMPLGLWADPKSIRNSTANSLKRANDLKLKTIAFPALGTGAGAFAIDKSAFIMLDEIYSHIKTNTTLERIILVLFDAKAHKEFLAVNEQFKPRPQAGGDQPSSIPN